MGKLLVGWSEVSITPEGKKIRLAGQFAERISEYVESPVTVTALAIESDGEQMIFCSCDLVKIGENLQQRVRDAVAKADPTIPTEKIILSAIHTHTSHLYDYEVKGPSGTKEILDSYLPPEKQYRAIVEKQSRRLADAAEAERLAQCADDERLTVIYDYGDERETT